MRKVSCIIIVAIIFFCALASPCIAGSLVEKLEDGIRIQSGRGSLTVLFKKNNIVHVSFMPAGSVERTAQLMINETAKQKTVFKVIEDKTSVTLIAGALIVNVSLSDNKISFYTKTNKLLLAEGPRDYSPVKAFNDSGYQIKQQFQWQNGEALYGLGQHQEGVMNWRGHAVNLYHQNKYIAMPLLVSSFGYGILWNNYSFTKFNDTKNESFLQSELADKIDYYFIYGPNTDDVISGYRFLTGTAPLFPKWAYGYIQSKERYKTAEEMNEVVREYRRRNLPLDCIVLDWRSWEGKQWGQKTLDSIRFSQPEIFLKSLHDKLNAHLMISIWRKCGDITADFKELKSKGYLYTPDATESIYDAFNEDARNIYWKQTNNGLFSKGVDAWWCDATEPELKGWDWNPDNYRSIMKSSLGSGTRYMNAYSLMQSKGIYENQRKTANDKRVFILTRSAWGGQQIYGAATWSGDIDGKWHVLKKQIAAGINYSLSGAPYWTTDIGGFFVLGIENFTEDREDKPYITNEAYKRLYVRWFQFGTFCPLFRSHGTDLPREIWRFGEPGSWAYDALEKFDNLRYQLMPYIYSLAWKVTNQNYTLMRGLISDFPKDTAAHGIADQYMFGPSILVNPVTDSLADTRRLYLPDCGWYNFWTGDYTKGGKWLNVEAPISSMPLFVKAGSIIPIGSKVQYAAEKTGKPVEIRIYSGSNASFTWYEDENDNYNYEKGMCATIDFKWKDKDKTLSISGLKGTYPGMEKKKVFNVVLVKKNNGMGMLQSKSVKKIEYNGNPVSFSLR